MVELRRWGGLFLIGAAIIFAVSLGYSGEKKFDQTKCEFHKYFEGNKEISSSMKVEFSDLKSGIAVLFTISDPSKVSELQNLLKQAVDAFRKTMQLSDKEAEKRLCPDCRIARSFAKRGISMYGGKLSHCEVGFFSMPGVDLI